MFKKFVIIVFSLGLIMVILGFVLTKGDFTKIKAAFINDEDYEFQTVAGDEKISQVNIEVHDNNIKFYKSVDETYKVEYYTSEEDQINTNISNGKLEILGQKNRWFNLFNWRIKSAKVSQINIYLPNSYNGEITLDLTSGNTSIEDFQINTLNVYITSGSLNLKNVEVDTNINFEITSGKIYLTNVTCSNLNGEATSGSITIKDSSVNNNTELEITSGNIKVTDSNFNKFEANATSGNITLSYVSGNQFITDITSGDTYMKLLGTKDDYRTILNINSGDILYLGIRIKEINVNPHASKYLKATGTSGDIEIEFVD